MAGRSVVRHSVDVVPELHLARRVLGWLPRRPDRANGRALRAPQILQARKAREGRRRQRDSFVKPLLVDLETEWRGGQNQMLLLLKGLRTRGHEPQLVVVAGSALEERAATAGIRGHPVDRF